MVAKGPHFENQWSRKERLFMGVIKILFKCSKKFNKWIYSLIIMMEKKKKNKKKCNVSYIHSLKISQVAKFLKSKKKKLNFIFIIYFI